MKVKAAHHIGLVTPHFNEMRKFYADTLGLAEVREWPDVPIVFFDIGSSTIELIGRESSTAETRPTGGWDHLALHVDSVDDAYAELVGKGVTFRDEPRNFKDVRLCFFFDPDSNLIELFEDPRVE